ncbi:hypothetical protein B0H13DRAFT_1881508 [Mycena leptocephala]|nr:hypothetical protein B0H13DRAFT_1881508 [Mycena leptocephala]
MKFSIAVTSLLASVVSATSFQARQYNDGQLLSPAAGATVSSGSQVTIKYRVYDSIDAGTRYILVGFEYSPDDGDHYTYPVGNLSLSTLDRVGLLSIALLPLLVLAYVQHQENVFELARLVPGVPAAPARQYVIREHITIVGARTIRAPEAMYYFGVPLMLRGLDYHFTHG